jgi:predicted ester cyclase
MPSTVATRSPRHSLVWQAHVSGPLESTRLTPEKVLLPATGSTSCLPRTSSGRSPVESDRSVRTATASEHNKRLVRRALEEIYANGDLEVADELIHPDFVDHEPAHPEQPTGPEGVGQTVRQLHETFGGLRFEVQDEIAEGDKVVQLVVMSGRHTGSLMRREPTGREFAVRHIYIWRIARGQIVEHWGSRDDLGLLGQLGLLEMQP